MSVGARLRKSLQQSNVKHPVILPKSGFTLVDLLIRYSTTPVIRPPFGMCASDRLCELTVIRDLCILWPSDLYNTRLIAPRNRAGSQKYFHSICDV